jgi:formylmethanofuran dehydrogenase subunit B
MESKQNNNYICPVCSTKCDFIPWDNDTACFEICPTCGIQFGYEDAAGGDKKLRQMIYEQWRYEWVKDGSQKNWHPGKKLILDIISQAKTHTS